MNVILENLFDLNYIVLEIPKDNKIMKDLYLYCIYIFANLGKGFLVLIVTPVALIMSLCTVVLIPMALIFLAIYIISIYASTLVASYVVGRRILKDCFKTDNVYLSIIFGVVLTKLICLVPVIGGLIAFILILYGLGIIFSYTASLRKLKAK